MEAGPLAGSPHPRRPADWRPQRLASTGKHWQVQRQVSDPVAGCPRLCPVTAALVRMRVPCFTALLTASASMGRSEPARFRLVWQLLLTQSAHLSACSSCTEMHWLSQRCAYAMPALPTHHHSPSCARATEPSRDATSRVHMRHTRQPAPLCRAELTSIAHHAFVRSSVSSEPAAMQRGRIARSARWLRRYLDATSFSVQGEPLRPHCPASELMCSRTHASSALARRHLIGTRVTAPGPPPPRLPPPRRAPPRQLPQRRAAPCSRKPRRGAARGQGLAGGRACARHSA